MKKSYSILTLAVAAMAAISCAKELEVNVESEKAFEPKVISAFTDDDVTPDTKTSLDGVSILWATTDNIKGVDGSDAVHTSTATAVSEGNKKATFTFSTVSVEDDLLFLAYPAEKVSNIDGDYVYATLPTTQTATAGSFANQANLAIAEGLDANPSFKNVGGLLSFIINNDDITSVTLSANENLTGDAKISVAGATFAQPTITAGKKFVTVSGTIVNGSTYYAVVYPGTYTGLKIEVSNSAGQVATYSNPNSLTVTRNGNLHIATLTIPAGKWVTPTKGDPYTWTFASGDLGDSGSPSSSVSKGSPSLSWNTAYTWGGASATKYLGWNSTYGVQVGSGSATNKCSTLVLSTSGYTGYIERVRVNFTQVKDGGASVAVSVKDVAFNCSGNPSADAVDQTPANYDFVNAQLVKGDVEITFTNTEPKAFYIKSIEINPDIRTPQTLSFPEDSYSVELSEGTFASPTLSGAKTSVTYSSDDEDIATVNASTGVVTLKAIGTANIIATAAADETYQTASTSYELNVIEGPTSVADAISAAANATVYTSGVVAELDNKGFVITDGTSNIYVYQNAVPSVVIGQAVKVRGTRKAYNNVAQIQSPTITPGATGQSVTRTSQTVVTNANATGYTSSTFVSLSGTLTITADPYYNVSIAGSSVKGSLYAVNATNVYSAGLLSTLNSKSVTVSGYVVGSSSSYLYIAVVDINVDPDTAYINTNPVNGTTIQWENDESGSSKAETISVFLNGNASGYDLNYTDTGSLWNITDDGNGTVTVYPKANNTSDSADKTLTLTISNHDDANVKSVITLKQKKQGSINYATTYTTSANCSVTSNAAQKVVINSTQYDCAKANKAGSFTITIPANTTTVHFFIAAWNGESCTVSVSGGTMSNTSITADSGVANTSPYTLSGTISNYYRTITPSSSSTTQITITLPSGKRAVVWGVNEE